MREAGVGAGGVLLAAVALLAAAGPEEATKAAPPVDREQEQLIYKCADGGPVVFADRPCGPEAETRRMSPADINTYEAPSVPPRRPIGRRHSRVLASSAGRASADPIENTICERITAELERLQSRMRAGYRAREGERLRERQRRLKERRYSLGCHFR